jgi:SAM-dependent methyltransferase
VGESNASAYGKIRESGMPTEETWSNFFDVEEILDRMQVHSNVHDAADFACGYGTFTIPAAQRIGGIIYAIDIDPKMIRSVEAKSRKLKVTNVKPIVRDLLRDNSGLESGSVDYVFLFNILHLEDPLILLREAFRVLAKGGRVGIIHWIRDPNTPRGPPLEMRPTVGQCEEWCRQVGFAPGSDISMNLEPYHFGFLVSK